MLSEGRIEIEWKGSFGVRFRSELPEPWMTDEVGFYDAEEILIFLVDSMHVPPQKASKAVLEAMTRGRTMTEKVACSDLQLNKLFSPTKSIDVFRRAM